MQWARLAGVFQHEKFQTERHMEFIFHKEKLDRQNCAFNFLMKYKSKNW